MANWETDLRNVGCISYQRGITAFTILVSWAYIYLVELGVSSLSNWDEGIYATAAMDIVQTSHLIVPYIYVNALYTPFLEKPPGMMWLQALSILVFGPTEFAVRFPSALATLGIAALTYKLGTEMSSWRVGLIATSVFLTMPYFYAGVNGGRQGGTDALFVFFGTAAVYGVWRIWHGGRSNRFLIVTGIAIAGALLTKGFATGVYVIVLLPLVFRSWRPWLHSRWGRLSILLAILPSGIWSLAVWLRYGDRFVEEIFFEQVVGRVAANRVQESDLILFFDGSYLSFLGWGMDPWVYLAGGGAVILILTWTQLQETETVSLPTDPGTALYLLYWPSAVFVFFNLTGGHFWYLFPMFPAVAILAGIMIDALVTDTMYARSVGAVVLFVVFVFSPRVPGLVNVFEVGYVQQGTLSGIGFSLVLASIIVLLIVTAGRLHTQSLRVQITVVGLVCVLISAILVSPTALAVDQPSIYERHATALEDESSVDTVYIEDSVMQTQGSFSYYFYLLRFANISQINQSEIASAPSIRYATVDGATLRSAPDHRLICHTPLRTETSILPENMTTVEFTPRNSSSYSYSSC